MLPSCRSTGKTTTQRQLYLEKINTYAIVWERQFWFCKHVKFVSQTYLKKLKTKRKNKKPLWDQFNTIGGPPPPWSLGPDFHLHGVGILPLITTKMRSGPLEYCRWSVSLVCRSCSALDRHRFIKIQPMLKESWGLEGTESQDRGTWTE